MQAWLNYFEWNRQNRPAVEWGPEIKVEPPLRAALIYSLQKFQLGESGEGRRLRKHAAATGDRVYAAAIDLFIKEEQEHARLMAEVLKRLDAPLLESDWSDNCFVALRHLFGLHQELMVLLLPEMIAKCYFRVLHTRLTDPTLKSAFAQIARDEEGHLAFHIEYLRRAFRAMPFSRRILAQVCWRMTFRATCLAVMYDHRNVLRDLGMAPDRFWNECGEVFDEVAGGIFTPAHLLVPCKLTTRTL